MIRTASFAEPLHDQVVACRLCPADCRLTSGKHGICGSRYNDAGTLLTDNYGEVVAVHLDPIEKKPLYHFYPGSKILSVGANACNFGCQHCQNWTISQEKTETTYIAPEQLADIAGDQESIGVAFTYTEPIIWFEYILDAAPLLKRRDLKVVLITNGYVNPKPLDQLLPWVNAFNIDLKSMSPEFYTHICKGKLEPVLATIKRAVEFGAHVEITNLLIPGLNDSDEDIKRLVDYVASVAPTVPLHFSAYHPEYHMDAPPTPTSTLLRARAIAQPKLKWVYLGNVTGREGTDTTCPDCGRLLVARDGYGSRTVGLRSGRCMSCGLVTNIRQ